MLLCFHLAIPSFTAQIVDMRNRFFSSVIVAMFRDTVVVVAAVVRTRPRAIPLAMITMRKSIHGFPLISIYGMLMGLLFLVSLLNVKSLPRPIGV